MHHRSVLLDNLAELLREETRKKKQGETQESSKESYTNKKSDFVGIGSREDACETEGTRNARQPTADASSHEQAFIKYRPTESGSSREHVRFAFGTVSSFGKRERTTGRGDVTGRRREGRAHTVRCHVSVRLVSFPFRLRDLDSLACLLCGGATNARVAFAHA